VLKANLYADLAPARGILVALLASAVLWTLISWAWWG